jgi:hypothetical protein
MSQWEESLLRSTLCISAVDMWTSSPNCRGSHSHRCIIGNKVGQWRCIVLVGALLLPNKMKSLHVKQKGRALHRVLAHSASRMTVVRACLRERFSFQSFFFRGRNKGVTVLFLDCAGGVFCQWWPMRDAEKKRNQSMAYYAFTNSVR